MKIRGFGVAIALALLLFPAFSLTAGAQPPRQVTVYYFHTGSRCHACLDMERWTGEVLKREFAELLGSGALAWNSVNLEPEANRHFIQDYQLFTKSVIISEKKGDREVRFKNLERVWNLLRDKKAFQDYIASEVRDFLGGP